MFIIRVFQIINTSDEHGGNGGFKKLENDLEGNGPLLGNGKVPNLTTKSSKMSIISTHLNKKQR